MYIVNITVDYTGAIYTKKLYQIYLHRPLVFYFNNNTALLLRNLTTGINLTMNGAKLVLIMVFDGMVMLAAVVMLFIIEPQVTFVGAMFLAVLAFLYYKIFSPIFRNWGDQSLILEGERNKWILQSLSGIRDVKITNSYGYLVSRVYQICLKHAKIYALTATGIHVPRLLIESSVVAGFLVVVIFLLSIGQTKGEIVTIMGLFGMATLRIMPSLNRLLFSASEVRRLESYIKTSHQAFTTSTEKEAFPIVRGKSEKVTFSQQIEVSNLNYSYPGSDQNSIVDLNITIRKGEKIGFVGESGSGKSTFMDIILGLLEPDSGKVEVDGRDIRKNLAGWHKNFGFVPQEIFLLDDTLRRNIAFATEDKDIDDAKIRDVLSTTQLQSLEKDLEKGLDTNLGEKGIRLSGGQRQRVVIARALYHAPDILVFDEATSSLDNVTTKEISNALDSLSDNTTVIIVAHRISTIKECDRIVVMEKGSIKSVDTYDNLIKNLPLFQKLTSSSYEQYS